MTGIGFIRLASRKRLLFPSSSSSSLTSPFSVPMRRLSILAFPPPSSCGDESSFDQRALQKNPGQAKALLRPDHCKPLHWHSCHSHSSSVRCLSTLSKPHNKAYYNGANPEAVLELLTDAGLEFQQENTDSVFVKECPFCHPIKGDPSNMYKLGVNLKNGVFHCFRCQAKGSWFDLKRKLAPTNAGHASPLARDRFAHRSSPMANFSPHANFSPSFEPAKQQETGKQKILPLPMPEHGKQAIYSSRLLDQDNVYLQYLLIKRGLTKNTLRKYGVGLAKYKFYSKKQNSHVEHESYTFPWQLNIRQIEEQEKERGAKFVHKILDIVDPVPKDGLFVEDSEETPESSTDDKDAAAEILADDDDNSTEEEDDRPIWEIENWNTTTDDDEDDSIKDEYWLTRRMKVRAVKQKSLQRMEPPGGGWGLFGLHTVPADAQELVLTEGEYDAMAVYQATGRPAISVPNGASSFPDQVLPLLEKYKTIYLWMDNDGPGQKGAKLVAKKLGVGRCKIVIPTLANCDLEDSSMLPKDANEALVRNLDLRQILEDAKPPRHEKIKSFASLKDSVFDLILNPEKYKGHSMLSLEKFSNILGGFRQGEMTVLTGPTGAGKTTFLSQFSLDMAEQGMHVLWGSFEVNNQRLLQKIMNQFAQKKLKDKDELEEVARRFDELPLNFMDFHGSSNIDEVLEVMTYAVGIYGAQHVIIDNLQFMISRENTMGSAFDKFEVQDLAIEKFRKFTTKHQIHLTLVVHPKKEPDGTKLGLSSVHGTPKATQEADNVLVLQSEGGKKYIDVKKNRIEGTLGHSRLHFDEKTLRYSENQQGVQAGVEAKPAEKKLFRAMKPPDPDAPNSWDLQF